jgi:predicted NBD/HSP70 family sugar kinase
MLKKGNSLRTLKEKNILAIFHAIREHGPVSRIEVGRILGLSNATSMGLTKELLVKKLICEKCIGDSSGGRKPVLLEINWDYRFVIGMILSQEGISCGVYNLALQKKKLLCHAIKRKGKDIVADIQSCALEAINEAGLVPGDIAGMTIGAGGVVDAEKASIIVSTHFRSREIIKIRKQLDSFFPFPLYLENYANLMALAEKKLYYPRFENLAFIQVDAGIGGGIIINNKILSGANGYAGEIGHMSIDRNGPECFCGNRGCIETAGSIPALLEKASRVLCSGKKSRIRDFMDAGKLTVDAIVRAFHAGDPLAEKIFEEEACVLYHAVMNIILLYDPYVIVLGGEIVKFGPKLLDYIQQKLKGTIFSFGSAGRTLAFSKLNEHPRIAGAGMYAIEIFFADPQFDSSKPVHIKELT